MATDEEKETVGLDTIDELEENAQSEMRTTKNHGFMTSKTMQKSATKSKYSDEYQNSNFNL
jgi:hypothetical protein